jgi:hypothetical protein
MGPFRKALPEEPVKRRALIASAARYTFGGAQAWRGTLPAGDRRWQIEAWRHYDQCGELRYATGWKGNACAQAVMYAADIDPDTGQPTGPTDNPTIRDIAGAVLGGPIKRPQNVRTIVLNLEMAGECYVVIVPQPPKKGVPQPDLWLVVSGTELYQSAGSDIEYTSPDTGERVKLGAKDTLVRIWNGHPRLQLAADSAVRALLPTLREIEKSSQNIAARLDSRLAGAGLLISPSEADFPTEDDAEPEEDYSLSKLLFKNMQASLADPGSAASQVPIVAEVPAEFADGFRHITFETPLSKEIIQLRDSAIGRLAGGLDLPREVVEGMGDSNHWSAWQVAEETYRTHLVPVLDVISDALTQAYLHPIATAAKISDVDRYMLAFDGSALIGEPDPLQQVLELLDRGLITPEAALRMLHIPEDYAPTGDEQLKALATRLVTGAPTLFEQPVLRRILGFGDPETPPAPEAPAITASGAPELPVDMASLAVLHALERAGNRLVSTQRLKSEFADVPRHEMHVRLKPYPERHTGLLEGAWRLVPEFAAEWDLDGYAQALIAAGVPHTPEALTEWMASRGR